MKTAEKLKIIRQVSGLTQERLAHELGVSFPTLNSWINGKSVPREKAKSKIDQLYRKATGQQTIPAGMLQAKKKLIQSRKTQYPNPLKTILSRPDIYDELVLSLTYNTNSIEGSTLSENETAQVLFGSRPLANKSLTEQMEAKNHQAAFHYLIKHLNEKRGIDEDLILKIHSILLNGIYDDAGFYRRHGVRIIGANVPTANHLKVPELMGRLSADIGAKRKDVISHVSEIHSRFEQIHPFADGNGRVGRLIMNAMLLSKGLPPAIIRQENKQYYYTCLRKAQAENDISLLEDMVCDAVIDGFSMLEKKRED